MHIDWHGAINPAEWAEALNDSKESARAHGCIV